MSPAPGAAAAPPPAARQRLEWIDVLKGVAILWIASFHFYDAWQDRRFPGPLSHPYWSAYFDACAPANVLATLGCAASGLLNAVLLVGYHCVGLFFLLSGFGLALSLERRGGEVGGWGAWYRKRLVRLYPMYWVAHLFVLFPLFMSVPEPVDWRWFVSLLGIRFWPLESIFYYLNPAWWYFGALIQLYVAFPLLYATLRRVGPGAFLALACGLTLLVRWALLFPLEANGYWVLGAFAGARLFEFAFGMAFAAWWVRDPARVAARVFSPAAFASGAVLYGLGLWSHATLLTYCATDGLLAVGLFGLLAPAARLAERALPSLAARLAALGAFSYGLYLLHQPFVLHFGEALRAQPLGDFLFLACGVLAILVPFSRAVERAVDAAAARLLAR